MVKTNGPRRRFFHHRFSSSSSSAAAAAAILPFFAHLPRVFAPQVWTARRRRARGVWGAAAPQVKCGECSRFTDERLKKIDKSMVSVVVFPSFFHGFFHRFPSSSSFAPPPPPPSWYIYIYIIRYRRCRNAQKKYIQFGTVGAETVNNIHNSIPQMPKRSKIHIIRHRRYRNYQTIIYFGTEGAETSPNIYIRHRRCRNARKYVYNSAPKVRRRSIIFIKYVPKVPKRQK